MPAAGLSTGLLVMGAKYLPTIKDQKAHQRFQEQQSQRAKQKQLERPSPAKKSKRK